MQFDLRNFFLNAKVPYTAQFSADFSAEDFGGSSVSAPVSCVFTATPTMEGATLTLQVQAVANGECARCLAPVEQTYDFTRTYTVRPRELDDPDFELPLDEKGCLNVRELAYQELIFEIPRVLLCSADCLGLCPICGKRRVEGCHCRLTQEESPVDARLSILKQLLS